jgi:hypothetical protein
MCLLTVRSILTTLENACNYHLPTYMKCFTAPGDTHGKRRPKHLRYLLFGARKQYIRAIAPYLETAETAFNDEMEKRDIQSITPKDAASRLVVFNLRGINGMRLTQPSTHLWSRALHLHPKVQWSHPCFRCQLLHKSMDGYGIGGSKSVTWTREYAPLNCGESLSIAMSLKFDSDRFLYE